VGQAGVARHTSENGGQKWLRFPNLSLVISVASGGPNGLVLEAVLVMQRSLGSLSQALVQAEPKSWPDSPKIGSMIWAVSGGLNGLSV